jgi:tetratricopeptide (TPR) repeat protein
MPEAIRLYDEASQSLEPLLRADPADPEARQLMANIEYRLGVVLYSNVPDRRDEGFRRVEHAVRLQEQLVRERPADLARRLLLLWYTDAHANALSTRGQAEEALALSIRACEQAEAVWKLDSSSLSAAQAVVRVFGNAAVAHQVPGRYEDALRLARRAYDMARSFAVANPTSLTCRRNQAWIEALLALELISLDRHDEALPLVQSSRATRLAMLRDNPGDQAHRERLIELDQYEWAARALAGRPGDAGAARRRALEAYENLHRQNPNGPNLDVQFASMHSTLA